MARGQSELRFRVPGATPDPAPWRSAVSRFRNGFAFAVAPLRIAFLVGFLMVGAMACATKDEIPVSVNYDPLVRFPAEARYVWDEAASSLPDDPAIDRAGSAALLKEVVDEGFAAHGYRAVASAPAEYRLSYQYSVHTFQAANVSRATGSVSLLLVESATGRRVWLGFGQAELHVSLSAEQRRARLADAVRRMLENFPPHS